MFLNRTRTLRVLGVGLIVGCGFSIRSGLAQQGDRPGHIMDPPPARWKIPASPVLSAEQEAATIRLDDGFVLDLVASEPLVRDPVALSFDASGRIWVAEMLGYMPDVDGKLEDTTFSRISVLEDTDGDGKMDKSTVFIDNYILPRALALIDNDRALLFADHEKLYEAEIRIDKEGKIQPGKIAIVDEKYAPTGNPEHKSNGLLRALDNWIYSANSTTRYRKVDGVWKMEKTEARGQWGITQDDYGFLLTNTNSNLVTLEEVPPGVRIRNPHYTFRSRFQSRVDRQRLWPARINPGVNRGYMQGSLDEEGYLITPTAASSLVVYRGDQYPEEYRGQIFVPEPSANLVKRLSVKEQEDGYKGVKSAEEEQEFLTSTDERNRIVNIHNAPDGTLYLVDMYRGIIQHKQYMTSYLRAQVLDRKLDQGIGYGRIWRVRYAANTSKGKSPRLLEESSDALVAHLSNPNGWWRDTAQRLLVDRGGLDAVPALKRVVKEGGALARIHAIWTLEGLGQLDPATLASAFASSDPRVVSEAIRASETLAGTDSAGTVLDELKKLRSSSDLHIRRQLATSLGLFGETALPVLVELLSSDSEDALLYDLAMTGISGNELNLLQKLAPEHKLRSSLIATVVQRKQADELKKLVDSLEGARDWGAYANALVTERRKGEVVALLDRVLQKSYVEKDREAVVTAMVSAGKSKKFKPIPADAPAILQTAVEAGLLTEPRRVELAGLFRSESEEKVNYLATDALQARFKSGEAHYQRICLGCHQEHGRGQQYLAPPLVGSEWVTGPMDRILAIILDGITGPIEVAGQLYTVPDIQPVMPGLRQNPDFTDEHIADIVTYVRNAWDNAATPVDAATVQKYRETHPERESWTPEELLKQ